MGRGALLENYMVVRPQGRNIITSKKEWLKAFQIYNRTLIYTSGKLYELQIRSILDLEPE